MSIGDAVTVKDGSGLTTNDNVVLLEQPEAFNPVNVYTVLANGLTVIVLAVNPPGFQV
jgi:hypothetical protein